MKQTSDKEVKRFAKKIPGFIEDCIRLGYKQGQEDFKFKLRNRFDLSFSTSLNYVDNLYIISKDFDKLKKMIQEELDVYDLK